MNNTTFFIIWLAFTIIVIFSIIPFLVWAIKSGHFSNFDYASRLALRSKIVDDEIKPQAKEIKNVS